MKFSFLNSFFFYSNESNQFANMCTEENSLRQPEEARGNQNITQGKNVQILSYVYGKKLIFNHIIHSHNSVFFMDTIIYLSSSSSSSGAMLYSVGDRDHVLPYSTVPCCFQDFNHLACSPRLFACARLVSSRARPAWPGDPWPDASYLSARLGEAHSRL